MTLDLTELEADFVAQAVQHELDMMFITLGDPFLTDVQRRNVGFKLEHLQQIMLRLVAS